MPATPQSVALVSDRVSRMLRLIALRRQSKIQIDDNPDAEISDAALTQMKDDWQVRFQELRAEVKLEVAGW